MGRTRAALVAIAMLSGPAAMAATQTTTDTNLVADVSAAVASGDMARGRNILSHYRSTRGVTSEMIEALSCLARGALTAKHLDEADQYAAETYDLAVRALEDRKLDDDEHLHAALAAAIRIQALVLMEQGARSEAVYFLRREIEMSRNTPIHEQIQADLDRLSLEGRLAPRIEGRLHLGPRVPSVAELKGRVVLLFFWAHWCEDCKAESPTIAKLTDRYRSQGLTIVAPTRRYGFAEAGRPAAPDKELRHIIQVRDTYYGFLHGEPVPVNETNYKEYGVASIPLYVLLDREGIVRLYHPGRMTEEELDAAIQKLL